MSRELLTNKSRKYFDNPPGQNNGTSVIKTRHRKTMDRKTNRGMPRRGPTLNTIQQQQRLGPCQQICRSLGKCEPGHEMEFYTNIIQQCRLFLQESLLMNDRKRITRIYLKALEKLFRLIAFEDDSSTLKSLNFQPSIVESFRDGPLLTMAKLDFQSPNIESHQMGVDTSLSPMRVNSQPSIVENDQQTVYCFNETVKDFVDSALRKCSLSLSLEEELKKESGFHSPKYDGIVPLENDQIAGRESHTVTPTSNSTKSFKKMKLKEIKKEVTAIRHKINSLKKLLKDHQTTSSSSPLLKSIKPNKTKNQSGDIDCKDEPNISLKNKELHENRVNDQTVSPQN